MNAGWRRLTEPEPPLPRFVWLALVLILIATGMVLRRPSTSTSELQPLPATLPPPSAPPVLGAELFVIAGCSGCHPTVGPGTERGPTLAGVLRRAEARLADPEYGGRAQSAAEYLSEATADHCLDRLPGYRCEEVPDYAVMLTAEQLQSLVQFMSRLPSEDGS